VDVERILTESDEWPSRYPARVFLGEDLLPLLVLALGAAMAVGSTLALVRPRAETPEGELDRPPVGRSALMIAVGTLAAVWALASLLTG
jgi:hypothetical protein